jgi:short-subunit dehydrogenase
VHDLTARYGPWALLCGASEGLGGAIAAEYARHGVNLVLVARREEVLDATAARLRSEHGVEVRALVADLAADDIWEQLQPAIADIDLGLFVYNACEGFRMAYLDDTLEHHERGIAMNVRNPALLAWHVGRQFRGRGRGSLVICCSMGGMGGQIGRAHYAAGKAYEWILCEGLWGELRDEGVDVLAYMVGTTATPNLLRSLPVAADPAKQAERFIQTPEACAARLVEVLDQGPVAFPSDEHAELMRDRATMSAAERVLGTAMSWTAPPSRT